MSNRRFVQALRAFREYIGTIIAIHGSGVGYCTETFRTCLFIAEPTGAHTLKELQSIIKNIMYGG